MQFGLEVIGIHREGVSGAGRYRETIHIVGQGALGQLEIVRPRVQDLLRCRENVARSKFKGRVFERCTRPGWRPNLTSYPPSSTHFLFSTEKMSLLLLDFRD